MKARPILTISIVFIIGLVLSKTYLSGKEGLIETLYIDKTPISTKTTKWTGLDSGNQLPLKLITKDFSIQWEGFFYLPRPQTYQIACLCNSICEIKLDGNLVYTSNGKLNFPIPEWKSLGNKMVDTWKAYDRNPKTRATTKEFREGGEWLMIDLREVKTILGITLDTSLSPSDFSTKMEILVSNQKKFFEYIKEPLGINKNAIEDFFFTPLKARYIKLINRDKFIKWWSIHELYVYTADDIFKNNPSYRLSSGNHNIQIKFHNTPELTRHIKIGGRVLCKIFIKNSDIFPLDKVNIYKDKITLIENLFNKFFWILITIPAIFVIYSLYSLKPKYIPIYLGIISIFFFFLYLFSLTPNQNIFTQDGNMFYTDNVETAYMIENPKGSYHGTGWNDAKHNLLFPIIIWPLYKIGQIIFSNNNLRVVFPIACLGTINIVLAFYLFKIILKKNPFSLIFSITYGIFFGIWLYSSFPERYILNILFINIFLLIALKYLDKIHEIKFLIIFSILNAIGILVTLHLVFLAIIPLFCLSIRQKKLFLIKLILYILIILSMVIAGYELAGRANNEFKFFQIIKYIKDYHLTWGTSTFGNFINPNAILNTILNFFFYGIGIIYVLPVGTSELSYIGTYFNTNSGIVFFFSYISFILISLFGLRRSGFIKQRWFQILIIWIFFNIIYFLYFNPTEAFLYGPLVHLPWLAVLATGYNQSSLRYKWLILGCFIISLFFNNIQYISILRHITLY